jgi:hypothetical protein
MVGVKVGPNFNNKNVPELNSIIEVKLVSIESGYSVAKKGNLKVIIKENHDSDF